MADDLKPNVDPALTDYLDRIAALAREAGADGVWVIREPEGFMALTRGRPGERYTVERVNWYGEGIVVHMRFPMSDGGEAGAEEKLGGESWPKL